MTAPLRLGLAGLGTVGTGVVKIVQSHAGLLAAAPAGAIEIVGGFRPIPHQEPRRSTCRAMPGKTIPVALARRADIDLVVEVMGGADGPAKAGDRGGARGGQGRGHGQQGAAGASTARRWPRPPRPRVV